MSDPDPKPLELTPELPLPRRLRAIAAISCGTALVVIDGAIANVALPTIARDLRVDNSDAVLVVTVYQLILLMTLLPFSALGDRIGHRTLYQYGLMLFTVATALCFFAKSLPFLLIVRAAQALGAGAVLSVGAALIRQTYPPAQLGRGLGVNTVIVVSAQAFAPTIGGFILGVASWPWIFVAAAPFGLISLIFGRDLPAPKGRERPYDVLGAVLCASTFGLIISGIESGVRGNSPVISAAMVLAGLLIGQAFVRRELSTHEPMLPLDLLAQPAPAIAVGSAFVTFMATMMLVVNIPFRLQNEFGFSPSEVGSIFAAWPMAALVVGPLAGVLSDRISVALLSAVGCATLIVGMLLYAFVPADAGWADIAWRLALCGAGYGMFGTPNMRAFLSSAPPNRTAAAGGMHSTNRLTGQTFGATLGAVLLAVGYGAGKMPGLVGAGLMILALLITITRFRLKAQPAPDAGPREL